MISEHCHPGGTFHSAAGGTFQSDMRLSPTWNNVVELALLAPSRTD